MSDKKTIKREVIYLYIIQISNMLLPLATFPYLARVLGAEFFGKLSYAQSISFIALFIVDFGFNFSAARKVSAHAGDMAAINALYSNVQCAKTLLFLIVMAAGTVVDLLTAQSEIDGILFFIGLASSLSSLLSAAWLFQGLGKNSHLAILNLVFRALALGLIFLLVSSPADIYLASVIQLFPPVLVGLVIQCQLKRRESVSWQLSGVNRHTVADEIRESFHNFSASLFTLGFTYLNPVVIKFMFGDATLGHYAVADRLASVLRQLYNPIVQGNFSHICSLYNRLEYPAIRARLMKVMMMFSLLTASAFLGNLLVGTPIIHWVFGKEYDIGHLLTIMIVTQFVISLSIILVNLIIIPAGLSIYLKRVYFIGLLCHFSYLFFFAQWWGVYGVAIAVGATEFIITVVFFFMVMKKNILGNRMLGMPQ
ncbi:MULTISPECIES: oligosaccharide flippase family protein [Dickeya]|uniref:oligosaccharide flippase family protein n=1 Tax=Dickeya TaxID=204037 RepID=UPI00039D34BE|nr:MULTISPECIES: oligosaccharide flippase family protein [Dickeya]AYH47423.1 polysaccharide biosynthesis protein [Dickeya fangzhongdai]MBO8135746.1 oligosaccharide flippase family protein [Dickeya fangzhongdai]UGA52294.1 oligosaccharide flippase family protein [Dickeya fangzhongdai]UMB78147.1 oligosaccharide flippase family protein [Dickeya fangzhongdai]UWH08639.1 oligosaccharide flippase family protein [Dickeya fangzhongdai]